MWRLPIGTAVSAFLIFLVTSASAQPFPDEPIAYIGHGSAFDKRGKEIPLTPAFIESAQLYYMQRLRGHVPPEKRKEFDDLRAKLAPAQSKDPQTRLYANGALIDWLLLRTTVDSVGAISGKNNLMKVAIRYDAFGNKRFVPPDELTRLGAPDLSQRPLRFSTMNSGTAYRTECENNGVPLPPNWPGGWTEVAGDLAPEFISQSRRARVFYYRTTSPEGICYALPRDDGTDIRLLGIICMGKVSSKVCFWDNQQSDMGFLIPLGASRPILDFAGGAELFGGSGGICTTCHSGENPYIIHPGSQLDLSGIAVTKPDQWYDPLVHPNWPQNAGPLTIFDGVPPMMGERQCTGCHVQSLNGRFPRISSAINPDVDNSHCNAVLMQALALTMPPGEIGNADFDNQKNQLLGLCNAPTRPVMRIEDLTIDYGDVERGFSFRKALVIHNDGDAALTVNIVAPTGDTAQWSEIASAGPRMLNPGDPPAVLTYTYSPQVVGTHTMSMSLTSNDGNPTVTFTGRGRDPLPIDTMLVLDRSLSMDGAVGERRKIDAMRDAASLYTDLLREDVGGTGSGDKLGMVKYNDSNSVYLPFELMVSGRKTSIAGNHLANAALTDSGRLQPAGYTGIGGAMQTAAFQFGGANPARRQVMVVLTDGIQNRDPRVENVIGPIRATFPAMKMYSIGLGAEIDPPTLQMITNVTGGYHQVQSALSATTLFDLETFYFKIFAEATDMDLVIDPTFAVNLTTPGPIVIATAGVISSDQSATFLVLDDPALRQFYDIEFVSPQGNIIVPFVTIGGIPVQVSSRHTYKLYRIIFPDISLAHTYVGDWIVRLRPNGRWSRGTVKQALTESRMKYSSFISPHAGLVPVGFVAAVNSDYKLRVALAPTSYLPGADVLLTATLSDRGWPAPRGNIEVAVSSEGGPTHNMVLYDDGTHGDQTAGDATWSNHFLDTATANTYRFRFHSVGYNDRGEIGQREATRYVSLVAPLPPPTSTPCIPCWLERLLLALFLLALLLLLYCCFFLKRR